MSSGANPAQLQAIRAIGHCVIQACPGAGKTFTLKERAKYLLGRDPEAVLCAVTFTADAAAELEQRIRSDLPSVGERLVSGTFHALCKRQLEQAGIKFSLISDGQQFELMRRAHLEAFGPEASMPLEGTVRFIEAAKSHVNPVRSRGEVEPHWEAYDIYQTLMMQMGAMDFSDLMIEATRGMQDGRVKPLSVTYMLIDEYQDTDPVQEAWVREHIRQGVSVTVVGDDDQSIFSFRHGMGYEGMERFRTEAGATLIKLNKTYRCAREILKPAAQLISGNDGHRVPKVLETNSMERGEARIRSYTTGDDELIGLVTAIKSTGEPHRWGVLARTNAQLDLIEQALRAAGVPYTRSGGKSFWELRGPALFLSICDSLGRGNMLGVDELLRRCGVDSQSMDRIHAKIRSKEHGALARFIGTYDDGGKLVQNQLARRMREWGGLVRGGSAEDCELAFKGITGFIQSRAKLFDSSRNPEERAKDSKALDLCATAFTKMGGQLSQRVNSVRKKDKGKATKIETKAEAEKRIEKEGARVMTLHSSKGLEFDYVWIAGCSQGTLPSKQGILEEERRLMYVGMTRARNDLTMSFVVSDLCPRSQFLEETGIR